MHESREAEWQQSCKKGSSSTEGHASFSGLTNSDGNYEVGCDKGNHCVGRTARPSEHARLSRHPGLLGRRSVESLGLRIRATMRTLMRGEYRAQGRRASVKDANTRRKGKRRSSRARAAHGGHARRAT